MTGARWLPRLVLGLTVSAVVIATLALPAADPVEPLFVRINAVVFAVVGVLATRRTDGRTIGWLCLALGFTGAVFDLAASYAETLRSGALWAYWFSQWLSVTTPALVVIYLPALFPTGRPLSERWRWLVPTTTVVLLLAVLDTALLPDVYETHVSNQVLGPNPVGIEPLGGVLEAAFIPIALAALVCALAALLSLGLRFKRARGIERLQIRWLLFGLASLLGMVVGVIGFGALASTGAMGFDVPESVLDVATGATEVFIPISIGLALTRYRLYDLDRIVSRTVAYALAVAVLAATYLGMVVGLGAAVRTVTGESNELVVALSTLAVAALFQPVRRRIQAMVDRRFNRARYDAANTVDAFSRQLRDELDLSRLADDLTLVATGTMHPAHVSVWLPPQRRTDTP